MTVVITAAIVSMLALSSLVVQGVNRKAYTGQSDTIEARINGETAIRMALLKMTNDPDWRYHFPNGDWEVETPFGNGTFTINVVDPDDGDLTDDAGESVVVTGTGVVGSSIQNLSVSLSTSVDAISALQSALHAGDDLQFYSVDIVGTGQATAGDDSNASGSSAIGHDVAVVDQVTGTGYLGTTTTGETPLTMPTSDALSFYTTNGTFLDISDIITAAAPPLPTAMSPPNKLVNDDFESGMSPWFTWGNSYAMSQSTAAARSGTYGCRITGRDRTWHGPMMDITSFVQNGVPYDTSAWVNPSTACDFLITIRTDSTGLGITYDSIGWRSVTADWNKISGTIVPEWTGTLNSSILYIETDHTDDFDVDDITFVDPEDGPTPSGTNLLTSGDMETNPLSYWYSLGATIQSSGTVHNGTAAIKAVSRDNLDDTLAQDVTAQIANGATYHSEGWVRQSSADTQVRLAVKLTKDDASTEFVPLTPWRMAPSGVYVKCYGQETVTWTGNLTKAEFVIQNMFNQLDVLRLDDAAMIEVSSAPPPAHTIYRSVLSPTSNPFGSGQTNADGIYVINCKNTDVYLQESRIVGTLVLLNPGSSSQVLDGAMTWSPAHSNFPALLVDGDFKIEMNSDGLNESLLDVNFNPVGTPEPLTSGTSDSDKIDIYLSKIEGLIYTTGNLTLGGTSVIEGSTIAAGNLTMTGKITADYSSKHLQNPPPGFSANPEINIIENSIHKSFD